MNSIRKMAILGVLAVSVPAFSQAPVIISEPTNCYAPAQGGSCSLTVVATGAGNTYQWYHNNSGDTATKSTTTGYNTPTHTLSNIHAANPRWVRVTNPEGFTDSITAIANYGTAPAPPVVPVYNGPAYSHIVIVLEENHNYGEIIGNKTNAPYINGTLVAGGANFTAYEAITHPSQPNYFAIYSGNTHNIKDDGEYEEGDPSLTKVLEAAGRTFMGYPETGSPRKHNPWESFPEGTAVERNFSAFPTTTAGFETLPNVSWVSPDLNDDMHDGTIQQGDQWLKTHINAYAQWAKTNNSLLIVTFDEGTGSGTGVSSVIPTIFYGAGIVPGNYGDKYNDYSTTLTILSAFGLARYSPDYASTTAPTPAVPVHGAVFNVTAGCPAP